MPTETLTVGDLVVTTAKLGGRSLTASKVNQIDYARPDKVAAAVARFRAKGFDSRAVWIIGQHVDGRTIRSAVYFEDRPHLMTPILLRNVPIDPNLYDRWLALPLVLL
jgi:hypothetical protein